jgi:hypothetical protein
MVGDLRTYTKRRCHRQRFDERITEDGLFQL